MPSVHVAASRSALKHNTVWLGMKKLNCLSNGRNQMSNKWEKDFNKIEKGPGPTAIVLGKWLLIFGTLLIFVGGIWFALSSMGLIGRTIVERKIFEQSFQYNEARKTAIATYEAQLAEINAQLEGNLDDATRQNLNATAASIRIKLSTERNKQ
jgi:hypothetical protein